MIMTVILQELPQAQLQFEEGGGMRVAAPITDEGHTHFGLLTEPIVILHALDSSSE